MPSDQVTARIAALLAGDGALQGASVPPADVLSPGLPERADPHSFSSQWNPWRAALEAPLRELQWAMMYPPRVLGRYLNQREDEGRPLEWPTARRAPPESKLQEFGPAYEAIAKMRAYEPGSRESEHVEDRRSKSIWQYR